MDTEVIGVDCSSLCHRVLFWPVRAQHIYTMIHNPSSTQVHGVVFRWLLSAPLPLCRPPRPCARSAFPSLPLVPVAVLRLALLHRCEANGGDFVVIPLRQPSWQCMTSVRDACAKLLPAPTFHFSGLELRHSPSRDSASVFRGFHFWHHVMCPNI